MSLYLSRNDNKRRERTKQQTYKWVPVGPPVGLFADYYRYETTQLLMYALSDTDRLHKADLNRSDDF